MKNCETPFTVNCTVEEADFLQFEFLQGFWEMTVERRHSLRGLITTVVLAATGAAGVWFSQTIVNEFLYVVGAFGIFGILVNGYNYIRGYRGDYDQLRRLLERAKEKGKTVFEATEQTITFGTEEVDVLNEKEGTRRFFYYKDITFFEETDRMYVIGLRHSYKDTYLYEFRKLLITKRFLGPDSVKKYEEMVINVTENNKLKPILADHPFK